MAPCRPRHALLLLLLAGCSTSVEDGAAPSSVAGQTTPTAAPAPPDPDDPTIARRPYTAEQIREAMPVGSWKRYLIESLGQDKLLNVATVVSMDDVSVTLQNQASSETGTPLGEASLQEATWQELMEHATFPLSQTTLTSEEIELPSGTWDCWLYEVTELDDDGQEVITRYHFAKDQPGAPVRYAQLVDGKRVFLMVLMEKGRESGP